MRRFVQALSSGAGLPSTLPSGVRSALAQLPDRYNISVRQLAGVMLAIDDLWHVGQLLWGLIPSWELEPATRYSTQAARLERAPRSRMYRRAWASRRCLVPMSGYYKWDRAGTPRQPYFVQAADGGVLFAAGLWERWEGGPRRVRADAADAQGEADAAEPVDAVATVPGAAPFEPPPPFESVYSFTVLTHPCDAVPAPLTPDGPVFIPPDALDDWVATDPRRALRLALRARPPRLEAYAVSRRIADRRLDHYSLLEPADPLEPPPDVLDPDELEDD
jgi:putative SOS response-associated peptidase YedK